jgi:hypothetical protein
MASQVQYRRGTNAQNAAFTGALAEITVDTTNGTLRVHDAITVGGSNIATVAYVNSQISSLSANSITNGTSSVAIIASGGNIRANVGGSTITNTYSSGLAVTGLISATGAVTAASVVGGVMTGTSVSVTGTINGTTLTGTSLAVSTGNITGGNLILSGAIQDSGQLDISTTASNGNIVLTPNGTGNVNTGANVSVAGRVTAASVVGANLIVGSGSNALLDMSSANLHITNNTASGNITLFANFGGSGIREVFKVLGTGTQGVFANGIISATGAVTAASVVGGVITGSSVSVTGTINGTTLTGTSLTVSTGNITGGNIVNSNANGVGNIGSSTTYFNTVFAKATSAQYADLAEMYCADSAYTPGTVLAFGGSEEVTITTQSHSTQVAGIVSTNPSYLMNSTLTCANAVQVALVGRVPCHVVGTIAKGDRLVASSTPGIATRLDMSQYQPGCIIGKALESYDSETVGTIEVAVGRF